MARLKRSAQLHYRSMIREVICILTTHLDEQDRQEAKKRQKEYHDGKVEKPSSR
jgi:hypothetical protein